MTFQPLSHYENEWPSATELAARKHTIASIFSGKIFEEPAGTITAETWFFTEEDIDDYDDCSLNIFEDPPGEKL